MFTIDWPGAETDRSSLMPSTRLTASSRMSETCVSTSSTDAPGSDVRTITFGRSTAGKRSTPRRKNDAAPTTTSARMSIAAKTGRLMQMAASVRMAVLLGDADGGAVGEAARATVITSRPASTPSTISTRSPTRRPDAHALLVTLPSLTTSSFSTPANTTSADCGTTRPSVSSVTMSALANVPGRSRPAWFGTSASIGSVRLPSVIAGLSRATRPS